MPAGTLAEKLASLSDSMMGVACASRTVSHASVRMQPSEAAATVSARRPSKVTGRSPPRSPRSGDGACSAQGGELGAVVAEEATERLVRVLAHGGYGPDARWSARELDRRAGQVHLSRERVLHLDQHLAFPEMRILGDLGDRPHGRRGNSRLVEPRADLVRGAFGAPLLDERAPTVGTRAARHGRRVPLGAAS